MAEIMWVENERPGNRSPKDGSEVRVSCICKGKQKQTKFIFYNNSEQKISHSGYMICGISTNRIYFKEEYLKKGYKIQVVKGGNPFILVNAILEQFTGNYVLHFDNAQELWYIEKHIERGEIF